MNRVNKVKVMPVLKGLTVQNSFPTLEFIVFRSRRGAESHILQSYCEGVAIIIYLLLQMHFGIVMQSFSNTLSPLNQNDLSEVDYYND